MEGLWNYLGAVLDDDVLRRYYPERHLKITLYDIRRHFIRTLLIFSVLYIALFYVYLTNQMTELTLIALLVFFSWIGVFIQKPNFKVAREMNELLRELYPDK